MSRHRGAKRCRRYGLLGIISLLSPAYLLSVERWPFHAGPPDHYVRLSSLLDLSVSQSGRLMPLLLTRDQDFGTRVGAAHSTRVAPPQRSPSIEGPSSHWRRARLSR